MEKNGSVPASAAGGGVSAKSKALVWNTMDHLLVVLPLLEHTPLPPASQSADFLALFPLGHGCSDISSRTWLLRLLFGLHSISPEIVW
jgi:hypothetical protein